MKKGIIAWILTMLIIYGSLYARLIPYNSLQSLDSSRPTIQIKTENNVLLWNTTWGGIGYEKGYDIAIDTSGDIYCAGYTDSFGAGITDFALLKFASNGTRLWNTTWGGTGDDSATSVAVYHNSDIYCAGSTNSFGAGSYDFALVKFAPDGTRMWNITWGGSGMDSCGGVAVDNDGMIYCAGSTNSFGAGSYDFALVKFAPDGTYLWNVTWGGSGVDSCLDLAIDDSGNIYCAGYTDSFGAGYDDFALVKFAPNGTRLWNTTWGGTGDDTIHDIAVNTNGDIYCVGYTDSFGLGGIDLALVKFESDSTVVWSTFWGGSSDELAESVAVDTLGYIYCAGSTYSFGAGSADFVLLKFAPNGSRLWNTYWGGASSDKAESIAVDQSGDIYCTGSTDSFGVGNDYLVLIKVGEIQPPSLNPITPNPDGDGIIELSWTDVLEANRYYIYREITCITSVVCLVPLAMVNENHYTDNITSNGTYYYVIVAGNAYGNSSISNCEIVTIAIPSEPEVVPEKIPGFELLYMLISLLALIYSFQRKKIHCKLL